MRFRWKALILALPVAVIAAGVIITAQPTRGPWANYVDPGRANKVLVTAFAVSHPGYYTARETINREAFSITATGGSIRLVVSPRSPYVNGTTQGYRRELNIMLTDSGGVSLPWLEETKTVQTVRTMGTMDPGGDLKTAKSLLNGLKASVLATATVELKSPIPEERISKDLLPWIDSVLLDQKHASSVSPTSWPRSLCNSIGMMDCLEGDVPSFVAQFRQWVSSLDATDASALEAFGLKLENLQESAQAGLVRGFIVTAPPEDLRNAMSDDRNVQRLEITDIILGG